MHIDHITNLKTPTKLGASSSSSIYSIFFSFTLYPANSRVGWGNLVLRHSVPHFLPNSRGIAYWVAEIAVGVNDSMMSWTAFMTKAIRIVVYSLWPPRCWQSVELKYMIYILYITFTLYLAYSKKDRGNLVLRHSVSRFRNSTSRFYLDTKANKLKY